MSKLVMIVDDSPTIRKIVEVVLHREGYEVIAMPDGVEALRYLLTEGARLPDLIVLDIEMPRLNGYQLAASLRKRPQLAAIPIVMISQQDGVIERLKARLAGAQVFISKPFTEQQLREIVRHLVGPAQLIRKVVLQGY
jgi:CheY-like chemotaxis protein